MGVEKWQLRPFWKSYIIWNIFQCDENSVGLILDEGFCCQCRHDFKWGHSEFFFYYIGIRFFKEQASFEQGEDCLYAAYRYTRDESRLKLGRGKFELGLGLLYGLVEYIMPIRVLASTARMCACQYACAILSLHQLCSVLPDIENLHFKLCV